MGKKRKGFHSRKKKNKLITNYLPKIGITLGAIVVAVGLFMFLVSLSGSEKRELCKKAGFDGAEFLADSCSVNDKYAYEKIAIVLGNTANTPKPTIEEEIKKYIINSLAKNIEDGVEVEIFSASSQNEKVANIKLKKDSSQELSTIEDYTDFF